MANEALECIAHGPCLFGDYNYAHPQIWALWTLEFVCAFVGSLVRINSLSNEAVGCIAPSLFVCPLYVYDKFVKPYNSN